MAQEDRFYYICPLLRQQPQVVKWNPVYRVEVEENVDFRQYISITINKLNQKDSEKPKSDVYTKVRPIIKEVFQSHYSLAIKLIYETVLDEGEFYLYRHSKHWFEVQYFSKDEKNKLHLEIDFRDFIESLWLTVRCMPGHKGRPTARKKATLITDELFKRFLHLTIQFLYDADSYPVLLEDFIKNFYRLCKRESTIEGLILTDEKTLERILEQLTDRKTSIEKRLIENDNDSHLDRAKLRGELEGVAYAIKVVNGYK